MVKSDEGSSYARIQLNESFINKTITLTGMVKNPSVIDKVSLLEIDSTIVNQSEITIPEGDATDFSLTLTTGNQNDALIIQFMVNDELFCDDLKLTVQ